MQVHEAPNWLVLRFQCMFESWCSWNE